MQTNQHIDEIVSPAYAGRAEPGALVKDPDMAWEIKMQDARTTEVADCSGLPASFLSVGPAERQKTCS